MPPSVLNADDLTPGIYLASSSHISGFPPGTPFQITAVSLPFIAIQPLTTSGLGPSFPCTLSAGPFHRLSSSYISSFTSPPPLSEIRGTQVDSSILFRSPPPHA